MIATRTNKTLPCRREIYRPVDPQSKAYAEFQRAYPEYKATQHLGDLRRREYTRLDEQEQIYLDYTGGGLYAESQVSEHMELLRTHVLGNPHSHNPTSAAATDLVEQTRTAVLEFFNADPDEYTVIFTPNATGALKLVGEAYPFAEDGRYLITYDNHNSVNGIREYARAAGAEVTYLPVHMPDLRVDEAQLATEFARVDTGANNLFAYPAQSNFSGMQHPLEWIEEAKVLGWDVLVDCAAFVPTNRLDLSRWHPDYVSISFYKMFGYPTGVGCLLVRKEALAKLHRPWFAGGTIIIASVQGEGWHYLAPGAEAFEDGTVNYVNLPAIMTGLRHMQTAGIDAIHARVEVLTAWLINAMGDLRHGNGEPLVRIYGPTERRGRGGTIAFNLFDAAGEPIHFGTVERLAGEEGISLRTGCFCNPGAGEAAHGIRREAMESCFAPQNRAYANISYGDFFQQMEQAGTYVSTIRVSLGIVSNFSDVYRFVELLRTFLG